jgi:hypothetical protein
MMDHRNRIRTADLWLLDLALTAVSFLVAYRLRALLPLETRTLMPFGVYVPLLAVMLPAWGLVLPAFRVYQNRPRTELSWILQLAPPILVAWLVSAAAEILLIRSQLFENWGSSTLILAFILPINYFLLVSYRLLLLRREQQPMRRAV